MRRRGTKGFTLTELLVVISIIAILAAILFPVLARAKEQGRQTKCTSNLSQLAKAGKMYAADWNDRFPQAGLCSVDRPDKCYSWEDYLASYIREVDIYHCPSAKVADHSLEFCYAWNHELSSKPEAAVYQQTRTLMFYDSADHGNCVAWDGNDPPYDNYEGSCEDGYYDADCDDPTIIFWGYMDLRHNDQAMVVYVDGHTGSIKELESDETKVQWLLDQR